jgi:hypothetical protein
VKREGPFFLQQLGRGFGGYNGLYHLFSCSPSRYRVMNGALDFSPFNASSKESKGHHAYWGPAHRTTLLLSFWGNPVLCSPKKNIQRSLQPFDGRPLSCAHSPVLNQRTRANRLQIVVCPCTVSIDENLSLSLSLTLLSFLPFPTLHHLITLTLSLSLSPTEPTHSAIVRSPILAKSRSRVPESSPISTASAHQVSRFHPAGSSVP